MKKLLILLLVNLVAIEGLSQITMYEIDNKCGPIITSMVFSDRSYDLNEKICKEYKQLHYENNVIRLLKPNQHFNTVNINENGFRGNEVMKEKHSESFRIIVVGSSHIFGLGTTDNNTIPALLQQKFIDNDFYNVEVINAGIVAANSVQEVYLINNILGKFDPDLLLIYDGYNDSFNIQLDDIGQPQSGLNAEKHNPIFDFVKKDLNFFATPKVIYHKTKDIFVANSLTDDVIKQNAKNWKNRWEQTCTKFDSIVILQPIIGSGNKTLVGDETHYLEDFRHIHTLKVYEEISKEFEKMNCQKFDMRTIFDDVDKQIFWSGSHISDYGNQIVANKLYEIALPKILGRHAF